MKRVALLLAFMLSVAYQPARSQWVPTSGPAFGSVLSLAVSGTTIFAGTDGGGVYVLIDDGRDWIAVNSGLSDLYITAIAVSGANIYAGTRSGAVFRSSDNGNHWIRASTGLPSISVNSIVVSGTNHFVATDGGGVFRSTDSGQNWIAVNLGLTVLGVYSIAIKGTDLFAGTYSGVFRSTDNGGSWADASSGLNTKDVRSLAVLGGDLFAGTWGDAVFKSTDNGTGWTEADSGLIETAAYSIAAVFANGTNLYAGSFGRGIFISTDSGQSWQRTAFTDGYVSCFAASGGRLFAGTLGGVIRSVDGGITWAYASAGIVHSNISALAFSGTTLFAGTPMGRFFYSQDNGATWFEGHKILGYQPDIYAIEVSDTFVFAGTWQEGIFRLSTNNAKWASVNNGLPASPCVWAFAENETGLYAGTWTGLYRTTDDGANWAAVSAGAINALAINGTYIFAGSFNGIVRSTDNGTTWSTLSIFSQSKYVIALAVNGGNLFAAARGDHGGYEYNIFRSTDNGATWDVSMPGVYIQSLAVRGGSVFAGGEGSLYVSTDGGVSWITAGEGLPASLLYRLAVGNNYLFAGVEGHGVWRRPLSELYTEIDPIPGYLPAQFSLSQNYPNPFNPSTTIRYTLPNRSHVTLAVFNTLGQQVATLVQGEQEAGFHEAVFDAKNLASGVYLYRLTASGFVHVKKLMLVH